MQGRRRFELKKGNKELFWEIWRTGGIITTNSGQLGKEDQGEEKDKDFENYRQAEVEFDRLIRARIQKGYVEVYENGSITLINDKREVFLLTLEKDECLYLSEDDFFKIFNWMVDPLFIVDKRVEVAELDKWTRRALRLCRFTDFPEDPDDFERFITTLRELTFNDRKKTRDPNVIPGFKFTDPQFWIINSDECERIHRKASIVLNKRIKSRQNKNLPPTSKQVLYKKWLEFNNRASELGGYEVRPISHRFESTQGKHIFGIDDISFQSLLEWLDSCNFLDNLETPEFIIEDIEKKRDQLIEKQKNTTIRISRNEKFPERKKYASFRKKFLRESLSDRGYSESEFSIPRYKFDSAEHFWYFSKAECLILIESIYEEGLTPLQKQFMEFVHLAHENKGFTIFSADTEEELIEEFNEEEFEEGSEEYSEEGSEEEGSEEDSSSSESSSDSSSDDEDSE